jgi:putative ABC transport system ATP-binding protein
METCPVQIARLNHFFGHGTLRNQILYDITAELRAGEIVIVTGPSGSGKTTLLTLIGALRSAQEGSLRVFGEEMRSARPATLNRVRKNIGYIFQAHNLLDALTASQNVQMSLLLQPSLSRREVKRCANEMLGSVGLADRLHHYPSQLSGGQKQRVAIARALAGKPKIILADEPTASLDKQSGRDVVDIMHDLAKRQGVTVLLVTHDNRILDVADRILHLEDGRLQSFTTAVAANTRHMMDMLAQNFRKGELSRHVRDLDAAQFRALLAQTTAECQQFLRVVEMSNDAAFESMLEQVLEAATLKIGEILRADRASLFLVDRERGQLWSKIAQSAGSKPLEIRVPIGSGIAGRVATTGQALNVPDAYAEPLFNRAVDQDTGYRTRSLLCVPIKDLHGQVFAVVQLLNKMGGEPFDDKDQAAFGEFADSIGVVLQSWWRMSRGRVRQDGASEGSPTK